MREITLEILDSGTHMLMIGGYPHGLTEAEVAKLHYVTRLKRNPTKLPYQEWDQLDTLLGKHGFGGYYDLVECLKVALAALAVPSFIRDKDGHGIDIDDDPELKTLPDLVYMLDAWAGLIANWSGAQYSSTKMDFAHEVWKHEHKEEK